MSDDAEGTAAIYADCTPPAPNLGLFVTQREYDEIEARLLGLVRPAFDDVMTAIASVLGQQVVERLQGHVVGIEIVADLPDDRWFTLAPDAS